MLLTIDLGNTSLKLGVFKNGEMINFCHIDGIKDNFRGHILSFLYKSNLRNDDITDAIISCVVPVSFQEIIDTLHLFLDDSHIYDINPGDYCGLDFSVADKNEVGDDLIAMCSYAYNSHHRELLVLSMGTAFVISHVDKNGSFAHCIIAPGYRKFAESLWGNAAQLPSFDVSSTNGFFADNTISAMNVGIFEGYRGMVEKLVDGICGELEEEPYIIACGGQGKILVPYFDFIDEYDADYVTKALNFIFERYYKHD